MSESGGFKKFMIFILVVALIAGAAYVAGLLDFWKMPAFIPRPAKTTAVAVQEVTNVNMHVVTPPLTMQGWCLAQQIQVEDDNLKPISMEILGWDGTEQCCVKRVTGFNCALNVTSELRYCYTSQINGEIKYVMIDGIYAQYAPTQYLSDYAKEYLENRRCDDVYYPRQLQT